MLPFNVIIMNYVQVEVKRAVLKFGHLAVLPELPSKPNLF